MKKKIKKILFVALTLVVVISSCVIPSFAWELVSDGASSFPNWSVEWSEFDWQLGDSQQYEGVIPVGSSNVNETDIYFYITLTDGNEIAEHFDIRLQAFIYEGSTTCDITTDDFGDITLTVFTEPGDILSDVTIYFDFGSATTANVRFYAYASGAYVYDFFEINYYDSITESTVGTLESEISRLQAKIEEKDTLINELSKNNVLDGAISGIGNGFANAVTPLLSLGIGGVTVGGIIGVFLIIGVILLFVIIVNKIRGA